MIRVNPGIFLDVVVNPGAVRSDIWRNIPQPLYWVWDLMMRALFLKPEQAAKVLVTACFSSEVDEQPDRQWYLSPYLPKRLVPVAVNDALGSSSPTHVAVVPPSSLSRRRDLQDKLWMELDIELQLSGVEQYDLVPDVKNRAPSLS